MGFKQGTDSPYNHILVLIFAHCRESLVHAAPPHRLIYYTEYSYHLMLNIISHKRGLCSLLKWSLSSSPLDLDIIFQRWGRDNNAMVPQQTLVH